MTEIDVAIIGAGALQRRGRTGARRSRVRRRARAGGSSGRGLCSPATGIVAEALVKTLRRLGQASGVIFLPQTSLIGAAIATACGAARGLR